MGPARQRALQQPGHAQLTQVQTEKGDIGVLLCVASGLEGYLIPERGRKLIGNLKGDARGMAAFCHALGLWAIGTTAPVTLLHREYPDARINTRPDHTTDWVITS